MIIKIEGSHKIVEKTEGKIRMKEVESTKILKDDRYTEVLKHN